MDKKDLVAIDREVLKNIIREGHEAQALMQLMPMTEDEYNQTMIKYVTKNLHSGRKYKTGDEALDHITEFDFDVLTEKGVTII